MKQFFIMGMLLGLIFCLIMNVYIRVEEKQLETSLYRLENHMNYTD